MKTTHLLLKALVVLAATVTWAYASDPTAVYARIERIVLEPAAGSPEAIQIWGVFSMAKPDDRDDYLPPARGYLYLKLAANPDAARKEWADLKEAAGTGQIVSFGSRRELHARLRKADERPEHPDPYVVSIGLTKVRGNTSYPPIRALIDYRD